MLCAFVPAVKGGKETRDIQPEREGGGGGGGGDGKRGKPPPKDGEIWGEDRRNEEREGEIEAEGEITGGEAENNG